MTKIYIYNNLASSLKNDLRKFNTEKYQHYLNFIHSSTNAFWKATKNITKQKNKIPPLRNTNNSVTISDWKHSIIILIQKPGKPPDITSS